MFYSEPIIEESIFHTELCFVCIFDICVWKHYKVGKKSF